MPVTARSMDLEDPPSHAVPVFLIRESLCSTTVISTASGIQTPSDLAARTVEECTTFGHDTGVWTKGTSSDDVFPAGLLDA